MSAKELMVNGKPLSTLRVVDLKEELEKRGLSKSGSKKDLADRLKKNLLLENQRSCQGAADEEQLPNISTREQLAEQNPFIRDYFQSQAELYRSQKVVKKLYEGMSQTPEEGEQPPTPVPKENEETDEQRSPSPPAKPITQPEAEFEEGKKSNHDVIDSSNSNHIEKDKVEESNGESDEIEKPKSQTVDAEKETKSDKSETDSKVEDTAIESEPKSSPVKESSVLSSPPQEEQVKETEVVEKKVEVEEPEVKNDKESAVIEKRVKKLEVEEKPGEEVRVVEKSVKHVESIEEQIKETKVVKEHVKEAEVVKEHVKEAEVVKERVKQAETVKELPKEAETVKQLSKEAETVKQLPKEAETVKKLPKEAETVKQLPKEAETFKELPKEAEVVKEHAKEVEVVKERVKEAETVKELPKEAEVVKEHVKEVETVKELSTEAEVVKEHVKEAETVKELPKEPEVVKEHVKEAETVKELPKEPEVATDLTKEPEVATDLIKEPEEVEKLIEEPQIVKKPLKKPEVDEKSVEKLESEAKPEPVKEAEVVENPVIEKQEIVEKQVKDSEVIAVDNSVGPSPADSKIEKNGRSDIVKRKDAAIEAEQDEEVKNRSRKSESRKRSTTPSPEEIPQEKVVTERKERKKRRASASPEKSSSRKEEIVVEKSARFSPVRNDHNDEDLDYEDEESDERRQPDESTWKRRNLREKVRSFTPEKVKVEKPKSPISHKNEENSAGPKPTPLPSKSSPSNSNENPVLEKTSKPFPIRSDQVDVDEVLDYGYEEADSKRDHEGVAWSRRILRLKNRCSVIEKADKKWNRIDRKPVVVTSSVLETFFPDVKLLPESEVKLEERIPKEPEVEKERVKTERESQPAQIQDYNSVESNLPNIKRKISIIPFEETVKELTPPRNPPSKILVITNLTRPFTLMQLKELLQRTGTIEDIWVDKIKSKCLAKFEKETEAEETRAALHGIKWPFSNPKALFVDFATESEFEDIRTKEAGEKKLKIEKPEEAKVMPVREWDLGKRSRSRSPGRTKRSGSVDRDRKRSRKSASPHSRRSPHHDKKSRDHDIKEEAQAKALDELFRKTVTTPCLYWLPLTPAQISEKEELRRKRMVERERRLAEMEKLRPR